MPRHLVAMFLTMLVCLSSCTMSSQPYSVSVPIPQDIMTVVYQDEPNQKNPALGKRTEKWFAAVLFGECRGNQDCQMAVGHVIFNRARLNLDKRYGKGILGVVKKRKAFSCLLQSDTNRPVIDAAMRGDLDEDTPDGHAWEVAKRTAHRLLYERTYDPTKGATHYHAVYVNPRWAHDRGMKRLASIQGHIFYKKEG